MTKPVRIDIVVEVHIQIFGAIASRIVKFEGDSIDTCFVESVTIPEKKYHVTFCTVSGCHVYLASRCRIQYSVSLIIDFLSMSIYDSAGE